MNIRLTSILVSALFLTGLTVSPADYEIGTFTDVLSTSGDSADFYYPTADEDYDLAGETFPLLVFLPGGLVDKGLYSGYAASLASHGYVVVIVNHFQQLIPTGPPQLFTSQQVPVDAYFDVVGRNNSPTSDLFAIVDVENVGVGGHDFGGVAAMFVADGRCQPPFCFGPFYQRPPEFKASANFGADLVGPLGDLLDADNDYPVAILHGSLSDAQDVADSMQVLEPTKAQITIDGLNIWGNADEQNPSCCTPDPEVQTRPQGWGIAKTAKWSAIFYDAFLKGDEGALKKLRRERGEKSVTISFTE